MIKIAQIDDDSDFSFLLWTASTYYNKSAKPKDQIVITSFNNSSQFWKSFNDNTEEFDLVLLDIQLGAENGYDVAKKIYANSTHDILPVVLILSTHVSPDETFASLVPKADVNFDDLVKRFRMLSEDANHRNITDVMLRSEDFSNKLAHI